MHCCTLPTLYAQDTAQRLGEQVITSAACEEPSAAKTSRFAAPAAPARDIAEVQNILRVHPPPDSADGTAVPAEPLRLAVCRVYAQLPRQGGLMVANTDVGEDRAVLVSQLGPLLVTAAPGSDDTHTPIYGWEYVDHTCQRQM